MGRGDKQVSTVYERSLIIYSVHSKHNVNCFRYPATEKKIKLVKMILIYAKPIVVICFVAGTVLKNPFLCTIKGTVQPFVLKCVTRLIRSAVKNWRSGNF